MFMRCMLETESVMMKQFWPIKRLTSVLKKSTPPKMAIRFAAEDSAYSDNSPTYVGYGDADFQPNNEEVEPPVVLSALEKREVGRAKEQQTFINAVSNNLAIGINDLSSVAAVSSMSANHDREKLSQAVAEKKKERLLLTKKAQNNEDIDRPLFAKGEKDHVHDTVIVAEETGSPRGRGQTNQGIAGPRKWRVFEPGQGPLPPYKLMPTLNRMEQFDYQGGERSGFGPPGNMSEKSKVFIDPYDIQTDKRSGWQVASPYSGEGGLEFYATMPKPKKVNRPKTGFHQERLEVRGVLQQKLGSPIRAHEEPLPWYPGTDVENAALLGWHRHHAVTENLSEAGAVLTETRLSVGSRLKEQRAQSANAAFRRHENDRAIRRIEKNKKDSLLLLSSGDSFGSANNTPSSASSSLKRRGALDESVHLKLEAIDAEIQRINQLRAEADKRKSDAIKSKQKFAAAANQRVVEFRKQREFEKRNFNPPPRSVSSGSSLSSSVVGAHESLNGRYYLNVGAHEVGAHPLPMSSPYVKKAKDLFKTFSDEDSLYL